MQQYRIVNTNDGWKIARVGTPGYIAEQYQPTRDSDQAIQALGVQANIASDAIETLAGLLAAFESEHPAADRQGYMMQARKLISFAKSQKVA